MTGNLRDTLRRLADALQTTAAYYEQADEDERDNLHDQLARVVDELLGVGINQLIRAISPPAMRQHWPMIVPLCAGLEVGTVRRGDEVLHVAARDLHVALAERYKRDTWSLKYRGRKAAPPQLDETTFWEMVDRHRVEPVDDPVTAAVAARTQTLIEEMG